MAYDEYWNKMKAARAFAQKDAPLRFERRKSAWEARKKNDPLYGMTRVAPIGYPDATNNPRYLGGEMTLDQVLQAQGVKPPGLLPIVTPNSPTVMPTPVIPPLVTPPVTPSVTPFPFPQPTSTPVSTPFSFPTSPDTPAITNTGGNAMPVPQGYVRQTGGIDQMQTPTASYGSRKGGGMQQSQPQSLPPMGGTGSPKQGGGGMQQQQPQMGSPKGGGYGQPQQMGGGYGMQQPRPPMQQPGGYNPNNFAQNYSEGQPLPPGYSVSNGIIHNAEGMMVGETNEAKARGLAMDKARGWGIYDPMAQYGQPMQSGNPAQNPYGRQGFIPPQQMY